MTNARGKKAAAAWKYTLTSPGVLREGAVAMAATSLLCFHSGAYVSDKNNLDFDSVKSILISLAKDEVSTCTLFSSNNDFVFNLITISIIAAF